MVCELSLDTGWSVSVDDFQTDNWNHTIHHWTSIVLLFYFGSILSIHFDLWSTCRNCLTNYLFTLQMSMWKDRHYYNARFRKILKMTSIMGLHQRIVSYSCSICRTERIHNKSIDFWWNDESKSIWINTERQIAKIIWTQFIANIVANTRAVNSIWMKFEENSTCRLQKDIVSYLVLAVDYHNVFEPYNTLWENHPQLDSQLLRESRLPSPKCAVTVHWF